MTQYYIIDLRKDWTKNKYISLWRPNNNGYAYPIPWAGTYDQQTIDNHHTYYTENQRYPYPINKLHELQITYPKPGEIDGNIGPCIKNTPTNKNKIKQHAYTKQPNTNAKQPSS